MNRYFNGVVVLAIAACLLFSACATRSERPGENTPEEMAAVNSVLDQIKFPLGDAYPIGHGHFEMGMLDGGRAVLLVHVNNEPVNAAFWTQGETVYAVNDAARTMNRALADAPDAITEERVRSVVH